MRAPKPAPRTFHKSWGPNHEVACETDDAWPNEVRGAWDDVTCPGCLRVGRDLGYWPYRQGAEE